MTEDDVKKIIKDVLGRPDLLRVLTQSMEANRVNGNAITRAVRDLQDHLENHPTSGTPQGVADHRHEPGNVQS